MSDNHGDAGWLRPECCACCHCGRHDCQNPCAAVNLERGLALKHAHSELAQASEQLAYLQRQIDAMRPVVAAALAWSDSPVICDEFNPDQHQELLDAVAAYREASEATS